MCFEVVTKWIQLLVLLHILLAIAEKEFQECDEQNSWQKMVIRHAILQGAALAAPQSLWLRCVYGFICLALC